jgi:hypothetical protein
MLVGVSELTFRNGVVLTEPLTLALLFLENDYSYRSYDSALVRADAEWRREDAQIANRIGARMSSREIDALMGRSQQIEHALTRIPGDASLADSADTIPWVALHALYAAFGDILGIGLAKATKALHKKRPELIPLLDSFVARYLRSVEQIPVGSFADDALALTRSYKVDLDANVDTLLSVQHGLNEQGYTLSLCRILDLYTWAYAGDNLPPWATAVAGHLIARRGSPETRASVAAPGAVPTVASASVFPSGVVEKLGCYVYRLIDPRNGETFYVGRGVGNRVFAHARAEQAPDSDEAGDKIKRIREIRLAGLEVGHVIHRHGMDEATAVEVEAALIDAYPGLTSIAGGAASNDYRPAHASEIIRRYAAEPAVFKHKALLISVNRTAVERGLYEAVRYAWKLDPARASEAETVLAVVQGLIHDAFIADEWLPATTQNFPGLQEDRPGRFGFIGHPAPAAIRETYIGKRVPDDDRKRGAANPIKYTW